MEEIEEVQRMTKPLIYLPSIQIMDLKASLAEKDSQLTASRIALAEKDSALAEKDSEIASLRAKLAAFISE